MNEALQPELERCNPMHSPISSVSTHSVPLHSPISTPSIHSCLMFRPTVLNEPFLHGAVVKVIHGGLTAVNCSFYDNWGKQGGAIHVESIGRATIEDCRFTRNSAGVQRGEEGRKPAPPPPVERTVGRMGSARVNGSTPFSSFFKRVRTFFSSCCVCFPLSVAPNAQSLSLPPRCSSYETFTRLSDSEAPRVSRAFMYE